MHTEEVPPPPPPPPCPPPPRFSRLRLYHNQSRKKMDIKGVPPPPPCQPPRRFSRPRLYHNQSSKKMYIGVPPPPPCPPPRPFSKHSLYHNQSSKKMDIGVPPPPPRPPPPRFSRHRPYHNQSSKKMYLGVPPPPPPPCPPPPQFSGFTLYCNQSSKKMDIEEVPPPLYLPIQSPRLGFILHRRRKMEKEKVPLAPLPYGSGQFHNESSKMDIKQVPSPPPPPCPLGFRRYRSKLLGFIRLHNQSDKELEKKMTLLSVPPTRHIQSKRYGDHNPTKNPKCPFSHPTHPHTLFSIFGINTKSGCFTCGENTPPIEYGTDHFFCMTCDVEFHYGCHTYPRKLTHPYHLQHPLTFTFRNHQTGIISDATIDESFCITFSSDYDPEKSGSMESDVVFDKCTWCGKSIHGNWFYRCSICNFCLDLSCSQNIPLLLVANPKSHHHLLVFYPRPLLTPCDACGLVHVLEPSYACFQCNYMVHQSCIDLPRVIKITRHQHRLFHTPCLQPKILHCRVCYKKVDIKYGQYSCNQEDCSYIVHSKCATHENVGDGEELEWKPEEPDKIEDIVPFKKVGSDLIEHFSHEHILKLEKYDGIRDAEKQCQACILPITSHGFYNCIQCDFFLHEVCAGLLRKLDHALHKHPLVLDPSPQTNYSRNGCLVCCRKSTGFRYKCSKENCVLRNKAQIDVRCILVPDCFTHKAHEHPLFISTSSKCENKTWCKGCKETCKKSYLQCTLCKFALCYKCATIPTEVCYKYDKHPLCLCYGEQPDDMYWCEVCEKELDPRDWFYACNKCCITIHLHCVFGFSAYMKPDFTLYHHFTKMQVYRNSKSTRPFCTQCRQRCPSSVYYKIGWLGTKTFCSLNCLASGEKFLLSA